MLTYELKKSPGLPLYEALYRCIRQDILTGILKPGEKLPSKRALAEHLRLSVITVEGAYAQLEAEGYVYTKPKQGFFVCPVQQTPEPPRPATIPAETPAPEQPGGRLPLPRRHLGPADPAGAVRGQLSHPRAPSGPLRLAPGHCR